MVRQNQGWSSVVLKAYSNHKTSIYLKRFPDVFFRLQSDGGFFCLVFFRNSLRVIMFSPLTKRYCYISGH